MENDPKYWGLYIRLYARLITDMVNNIVEVKKIIFFLLIKVFKRSLKLIKLLSSKYSLYLLLIFFFNLIKTFVLIISYRYMV